MPERKTWQESRFPSQSAFSPRPPGRGPTWAGGAWRRRWVPTGDSLFALGLSAPAALSPQERRLDALDHLVALQHHLRHRLPGAAARLQQPHAAPRGPRVRGAEPRGEVGAAPPRTSAPALSRTPAPRPLLSSRLALALPYRPRPLRSAGASGGRRLAGRARGRSFRGRRASVHRGHPDSAVVSLLEKDRSC